ncbi:MAG: MotB family protein [Alphaproteobacteria bacterium]|nr:MotB family protein [Alphaproteobacteria bacterium]
MSEDVAASEIIIVRRRGHGHDDGHGSTAWKIAFADFMTAMMALFLVLWLTNATDMATKKQIATYFNPIELTDIQPLEKGIRAADGEVIVDREIDEVGQQGSSKGAGEQPGTLDGGPEKINRPLFSDPYDVIRKLSEKVGSDGAGLSAQADANGGGPAVEKGDAYRDPFDPAFRSETLAMARSESKGASKTTGSEPHLSREETPKQSGVEVNGDRLPHKSSTGAAEPVAGNDTEQAERPDKAEELEQQQRAAVKRDAKLVAAELKKEFANVEASELPSVEVSVVPEGILISLTDHSEFEMFSSASARPGARLTELIGKIGVILKSMEGAIVVGGHTDARPFRTAGNDNWQLSIARAYAAYDALAAAGIEQQRFERIEGYADRKLRDEADPNAAVNRRIEVLLRKRLE